MKKLIVSVFVIAAVALVTGFSFNKNSAGGQTEEYALMEVRIYPYSNKNAFTIGTTVGEQATIYDEVSKVRNEEPDWGKHVIIKMHELNAQGFELLNSSVSLIENQHIREVYHLYTFVKKVR